MQAPPLSCSVPRLPSARELGALEKLGSGRFLGVGALGTVRGGGGWDCPDTGPIVDCRRTSVAASTASTGQRHPTTPRLSCHGPAVPISHHTTLTTRPEARRGPPIVRKCTTTGLCLISRTSAQHPLPGPSPLATGASSRCCSRQMSVMCPKLGGRRLLTYNVLDRAPQRPTLPFLSRPSRRSVTTLTPPLKLPWSGGQSHTRICTTSSQHRPQGAAPRRSAGGNGAMPRGKL
jgi:hypothetical protein